MGRDCRSLCRGSRGVLAAGTGRRRTELPAKRQIGLNQIVLHQNFQSLGEAFRRAAVNLADVFEGVGEIQDIQGCNGHNSPPAGSLSL